MTHLPLAVDAARFCLVKTRFGIVWIEAYDQCRNAEGADTTRLGIALGVFRI
jgi:hypothetical protein